GDHHPGRAPGHDRRHGQRGMGEAPPRDLGGRTAQGTPDPGQDRRRVGDGTGPGPPGLMAGLFEKRIRRAEFLEKEWPFAGDLLRFYRRIFQLQSEIYRDLNAGTYPDAKPLVPHLQRLLDLVSREGPPELAERASTIAMGPLLVRFTKSGSLGDTVLEFFPRVVQSVVVAWTRDHVPAAAIHESQLECPACRQPPGVSLLREDKAPEPVRRSLICSLCPREWEFARVLCPSCKEERPEKLPRYSAQEIPW